MPSATEAGNQFEPGTPFSDVVVLQPRQTRGRDFASSGG
jgi:hypothetical protein